MRVPEIAAPVGVATVYPRARSGMVVIRAFYAFG